MGTSGRNVMVFPVVYALALLVLCGVSSDALSPPPPISWSGPHIADLNILLPPRMSNPVQYRLLGSGGCFKWTWDHHDILSVEPEYNGSYGCATSARLTSVAPYSGRKETAVYASDINSGNVIRCEVFIDKIARIQIFHHSVKLDLGGLATLRIRAFDENENVFSSLVGLQFKWSLMPEFNVADSRLHHLVHVPLKETPLSDCGGFCGDLDTQIRLEDSGAGSDLYVVKGVEIGHEVVTAQLIEPQVDHMMDKIVLTVAELMSLDPPSPVFVIVGTLVEYKLRAIRQNTPTAINLPSPYHQWSISNATVAKVDGLTGVVNALSLGFADVIVEDTRVAGHKQTSTIHVVIPARLSLCIIPVTIAFDPLEGVYDYCPSGIWYVISGQQYVVHMKVLSPKPEEKEIYLTESNDLSLETDNFTYWDISLVSADVASKYDWHTSRLLRPHSEGQGTLMASLTYRRGQLERVEVLKLEQPVLVCNKVSIHTANMNMLAEAIHLPWAPGLHQEIELIATGGCGKTLKDYHWFSSNETILSVSASGVVCATRPGQAVVKVVSAFDMVNHAEVIVEVSIPSSMTMLQHFPVEAAVGNHLQAAVTLNTSNGNYYHRCDVFLSSIRWSIFSRRECFKIVNATGFIDPKAAPHVEGLDSPYSPPCAWTEIYTSCTGRATLHATFSREPQSSDEISNGQIILQASKFIAAYPPLFARQAGNGNQFGGYWVDLAKLQGEIHDYGFENFVELLLVPGTTMDILLLGGPERWDQLVEFIDTLSVTAEESQLLGDEIVVKPGPANEGRLYTVLCQTIGNYRLVFTRGNLVGPGHFLPAIENLEFFLACTFPSSITLIANEHANTHEVIQSSIEDIRGPGNVRLSPISVANGRSIRMAAVGIHSSGRPFANLSSLYLRWELTGCEGLAHWEEVSNSGISLTTWEKFLFLHNASGQCIVRATISGFSGSSVSHLSKEAHLLFKSTVNGLTDAIKLQLVSSLIIVPDVAVLVFNPNAKINMSVTGGTCFLEATLNDTRVAEVIHHPGTGECSWLILAAKGLGSALLTIYDKGLSPMAAATAVVRVSAVDWIKVNSEEEIFMLEGTTRHFDILAGTQDGSIFDSSQYSYMNIHLHLDQNVLKVFNEDGSSAIADQTIYQPNFEVRAEKIGFATFYVSVGGQSGNWIVSQHISVEVYPALRIRPGYIFLSPGAAYMIVPDGGPSVGTVFEYSSLDNEIAIVNRSTGLVSSVTVGNATIHLASYGNGGSMVCEAFGRVEVGIPPAMVLSMQSEQLCIGCQMPIFPSYPEGNLFSFYEVCKGYKWSIEDEEVLDLHPSRSWHSDVPELHASSEKEKDFPYNLQDKEYGFVNILYGRSAGRTKVSVLFSCEFVSSGSKLMTSYTASRTLTVIADPPLALGLPITWVLPPFYTTSDILPQSSESHGRSDSRHRKKNVIYSLLSSCEKNNLFQEDVIAIAGTKIKTRESNNLGCLQAKDHTGRTDIACCVRVAEVSQVRVSTKEFSSHVVHIGVNDELDLTISYCDDLGYPFLEAHGVVPLEVETNNHLVVSIHMPLSTDGGNFSRGLAHLQAQRQGKALVKLSIKDYPQMAAYILVLVGAQLVPRNPILHVGNFVNFSIVGDGTSTPELGRWLSMNESVISVNMLTGQAHAHAVGNTHVQFAGPSMKHQTTVTVLRNDQILVHAPAKALTNVPFPSDGYKFSVSLSHSLEDKYGFSGTSLEVPFDCWVDPPYVGYAKPWRNQVTGASYCLFFPYSPNHLVSFGSELNNTGARLLTSDDKGLVYVSIVASLREAQHIMGSAHALFVGGFSVAEVDRLNLSFDFNKTRIVVTGNADVQIHWNAKDFLVVRLLQKYDYGVGAHMEYEVQVLKRKNFTDKITITLPATGQLVDLDVIYNPGESSPPEGGSSAIWVAILACLIILLFTVLIFVKFLGRPGTYQPSRQQATPPAAVGNPLTPERTPTGSTPSPIRTPQPFVEYVRRTLDETPYYKRNGRRRFDPQYTY